MVLVALRSLTLLLAAIFTARAAGGTPDVTLVLSFCTSYFDGKGAVVTVRPDSTFKVIATFALPKDIGDDCPSVVNDDVVSFVNQSVAYLDFSTQWGLVLKVDLQSGSIVSSVKPKSSTIFDGFVAFDSFSASALSGLAGHVEPKGHYCENGCFSFGRMDSSTGDYRMEADIPYKAVMTGSHLIDSRRGLFFTQASYPLTPEAYCGSDATQLCLLTIDGSSGEVLNATGPNAWVAYAYMPLAADRALVWAHDCISVPAAAAAFAHSSGAPPRAASPASAADCNFAFLHVDISTSSIVANISRIPKTVIVHTTPEKSAFSSDGLHLAQASGNAYTGAMQLLVFDVASGQAVVNSDIPGLKEALGVAAESPFISVRMLFRAAIPHLMSPRSGPFQRRSLVFSTHTCIILLLLSKLNCYRSLCCCYRCRDSNMGGPIAWTTITSSIRTPDAQTMRMAAVGGWC
jgi:hypothetical protein